MKFVENNRINNEVVKIVEELKKGIISNFYPKSIILSGSFGRGEATAFEENGKLKFLSDCEITIMPYRYIFSRSKIDEFESKFYERTGLKVGIWGATHSFYLITPFLNKKMKPTMENYDLKYGSQVIYGKDYFWRIPNFKPEDIPLWEGIRLLFNRMAESLEYFSLANPKDEMVFWTDKIVLACQDALLITLGKYQHSYRKRNELFQNLFSNYFSELENKTSKFLDLTIEVTERKLCGMRNVNDPIEYWFDTAKICDEVFRYVIKKDMGIRFKDYLEFQEKYLRNMKIRTNSCRFFTHPIYQNLRSAVKMLVQGHSFPSITRIWKVGIPWTHVVYSTIPAVYFGVSKDGKVNEPSLTKARESLSRMRKSSRVNSKPSQVWEHTKRQALALWWTLCC